MHFYFEGKLSFSLFESEALVDIKMYYYPVS